MKMVLRKIVFYLLTLTFLFWLTSFTYVVYLKFFPPITTSLMMMRGGEPRTVAQGEFTFSARWLRMSAISDHAKRAVIAAEDAGFAKHNGFDWDAINNAFKSNQKGKGVRKGGSTITQQVAKNVFLVPSRTFLRKGLEAYFTFLIEFVWSKERILQMYLNVAEMGDGIFGVEAASQSYFKKPAADLTAGEAATLAAILPNPRKYSARKPGPYIRGRKGKILVQMAYLRRVKYLEQL